MIMDPKVEGDAVRQQQQQQAAIWSIFIHKPPPSLFASLSNTRDSTLRNSGDRPVLVFK